MLVMGIDPSLVCTGLALMDFPTDAVEDGKLLKAEVFWLKTAVEVDESWIAERIFDLCRDWVSKCAFIGIEDAVLTRSGFTFYRQALVIGGIRALIPAVHRSKVIAIKPTQTKAAIGVHGIRTGKPRKGEPAIKPGMERRTKDEVVASCIRRYGDSLLPVQRLRREAVCDAVGVACAAHLLS